MSKQLPESADDHSLIPDYFLEVVKKGVLPSWPLPENELTIGSQALSQNYIQYWAYPKKRGVSADTLPEAEYLASNIEVTQPVLLINQTDKLLELIGCFKKHAWFRSETSLENLEDGIAEVLEFTKNQFSIKIDNFMTTNKVSAEVEEKLDQIEGKDFNDEDSSEEMESTPNPEPTPTFKQAETKQQDNPDEVLSSEEAGPQRDVLSYDSDRNSVETMNDLLEEDPKPRSLTSDPKNQEWGPTINNSSRNSGRFQTSVSGKPLNINDQDLGMDIKSLHSRQFMTNGPQPLYAHKTNSSSRWVSVVLVLIFFGVLAGSGYLFRDKLVKVLPFLTVVKPSPTPIPSPEPSPTPTVAKEPTVDRAKYKVRVLNGTTTSGAAKTLADSLKDQGWQIDKTGNATNSSTLKSYVRAKKELDDATLVLIKDLSWDQSASNAAVLKDMDSADLEVIIGRE